MMDQEYRQAVYKLAKVAANRDRWGPELFKSLQRSCYEGLNHEREPCVFNILRETMEESEYNELDLEYCECVTPGQRRLNEYIIEENENSKWKDRRKKLLLQKKNLLISLLKLKRN